MEIERRLSSIQWKITRSFLVATFVSAFFSYRSAHDLMVIVQCIGNDKRVVY